MYAEKQRTRIIEKARRLLSTYDAYRFTAVDELAVQMLQTTDHLRVPPTEGFAPVSAGDRWGGEWSNAWFCGRYTVPEGLAGKTLWVLPQVGGWEGFLFRNGQPYAIFANKYTVETHGNHYAAAFAYHAAAGESYALDFEYYAGHYIPGCAPFEDTGLKDCTHIFDRIAICTREEEVNDFLIDLSVLLSLYDALPESSFRRGDVERCLSRVVAVTVESPADNPDWHASLQAAREVMAPVLAAKNADSAPICALIGHSHMDTAWLWNVPETIRKCARTYANAVRLMDEYPEYRFFQSSSYHAELIRRHYPALFERMREKIAEGRYEQGGTVWVECDCNMTSGESMVRQFLWGQRYTEKQFGYRSSEFWLPDTFGYSAAIPQIMQGCGVRYFYTTKLSWNDTNGFPYDTFYWRGLDGTQVFTHFNATHCYPDPKTLTDYTVGREGFTQETKIKQVSRRKLIAYGLGDGGGGPEYTMIETARRLRDLDGCPRAEHRSVHDFSIEMEREAQNVPVYSGELYLELHRGTLTNKHEIKRNNRKAEIALHDLEVASVLRAVTDCIAVSDRLIAPLTETLLKNQFHDILPGTCIARVHEESIAEMHAMRQAAAKLLRQTADAAGETELTVLNPLGFARRDVCYLPHAVEGLICQTVETLLGGIKTAVSGLALAPFGSRVLSPGTDTVAASPFHAVGNLLETPFYRVRFTENGEIASLIDRRCDRKLAGEGNGLNTFLFGEDVPYLWDNWDVDRDAMDRLQPCAVLCDRKVVADGAVEYRIRSTYRLSEKTTLQQDMVFYAADPLIRFDTRIRFGDRHRFLKVAFDTNLFAPTAAHEIQFGYLRRPTTRSTAAEQAMFEVCNHRYTDLSEPRYGAAVLNDCKYGISVEGGSIRLSLHKSGCRPDDTGDLGTHDFTYAFLPHPGGLSAERVVQPAACLNDPVLCFAGARTLCPSPIVCDAPNVLIDTLKPLHEGDEKTFVARLYECEGCRTKAHLTFGETVERVQTANLLEDVQTELTEPELLFRPFEIKTLLIEYR